MTANKREGDGGTPRATLRPLRLFFRPQTIRPRSRLPMQAILPTDGWCDDAKSPHYNRAIRMPANDSHEVMWRDDHLYDFVIDLSWNRYPAVRGRGSAIFLHLARPGFAPTEGCIAVTRAGMVRLLSLIGPKTRIEIR